MTNRMGPQTSGQAHPNSAAPLLPVELAAVALIDAKTCAAPGAMSVSWWHEKVATGEAPQPAVRAPRCTRWRVRDVADFWRKFAEQGNAEAAAKLQAHAAKASAAAKARRTPATQ